MQEQLLALMDIQVWEARYALPGAKTSICYETFELKKNGQTWGFLLIENFCANEEMNKLLSSIIKAIDMEYVATVIQEINKEARMIIMGKKLGQKMQQQYPNAVVTYHPMDLLHNPNLKRDVWMTLKKFK